MGKYLHPVMMMSSGLLMHLPIYKGYYPGLIVKQIKDDTDLVKQTGAFQNAQTAQIQIILHMRKISSRHLFYIL